MLDGLSPARRRLVLGVVALALVAVVVAAGALWATRDEAVRPVSQGTPGPVLLVPGYGGGTAALDVLADALRAAGPGRSWSSTCPATAPATSTSRRAALDRAVGPAMQRAGARSVDVVGYSAGGVVARLWVARPRRRQRRPAGSSRSARRTTAPTWPALAGDARRRAPAPTACQQLAPDSDLLRALNAGDETPAGPALGRRSGPTRRQDRRAARLRRRSTGALDFTVQSVCPDVDGRATPTCRAPRR